MDRPAFEDACESLGLHLGGDRLQLYEEFEEALYERNAVMNLTRVPREECWARHLLDSLLFHDLVPHGSNVLDIGTGPGFPAWPLAAARPDLRVCALDSSGKMLGFLRTQPLENLECVEARAENWGVREKFDVVTGRAVAPLAVQLELSAAPCRVGGLLIPMRTPADAALIQTLDPRRLGLRLHDLVRRSSAPLDAERLFPVYEKVSPTPPQFPRPWAEIKRKPFAG